METKTTVEDILARAEHQHITAGELDILVSKTREISRIRERELATLHSLLEELESHLHH